MDDTKDTVTPQPPTTPAPAPDPDYQQLQAELNRVRRDNDLIMQMAQRGVVDIEAAALLVSRRTADQDVPDIDAVLDQLRQDRPWLFGQSDPPAASAMNTPTASARSDRHAPRAELDRAALTARQTGKRRDLIAYLRLRRTRPVR